MSKKKIILFDIDYTLFDTTKYKKNVANKIAAIINNFNSEKVMKAIEGVYHDVRSFGSFDPHLFAEFLSKKFPGNISEKVIEEIWWQKEILKSAIYPETISVLQNLQKKENIVLGIFSSGKTEFQLAKISYLEDFFHKDHIHIASFKEETLPELISEYANETVVLVDDFIGILHSAKKIKSALQTIWMKRGRFAEKAVIPAEFQPDAIISNLTELLPLVDSVFEK